MKKTAKKAILSLCAATSLLGSLTISSSNISAKEVQTYETSITTNTDEEANENIISVVDPYIEETTFEYKIKNEAELIQKIGQDKVNSLKNYLVEASKEKQKALRREAVKDVHVSILKKAGASVSSHWWGKRIKTPNKTVAVKVRKLASDFSGASGDAALVATLTAFGIGFIPGFGTASSVASAVVGVVSWADARTWSKVSEKMLSKIAAKKYKLTIDVNKWNMEVKVY